eukprot:4866905-Pyramimonas_sp.AAC.1
MVAIDAAFNRGHPRSAQIGDVCDQCRSETKGNGLLQSGIEGLKNLITASEANSFSALRSSIAGDTRAGSAHISFLRRPRHCNGGRKL